ncbi:hypothetical protein EYF80_046837 [Liparis tanakae]|uniref:Uncharacterized protein n=1 Tax=Liparis tanakae TaxID=230148 RepID=A0A4Z2FQA2_9TELE|nr:hypothetical protein EYF80_046837 [Liparis tanakae]
MGRYKTSLFPQNYINQLTREDKQRTTAVLDHRDTRTQDHSQAKSATCWTDSATSLKSTWFLNIEGLYY